MGRVWVQVGQEGVTGVGACDTLWMPMEYEAQATWRWLDWARFYFYRCHTIASPYSHHFNKTLEGYPCSI